MPGIIPDAERRLDCSRDLGTLQSLFSPWKLSIPQSTRNWRKRDSSFLVPRGGNPGRPPKWGRENRARHALSHGPNRPYELLGKTHGNDPLTWSEFAYEDICLKHREEEVLCLPRPSQKRWATVWIMLTDVAFRVSMCTRPKSFHAKRL